MDNPTSITLVLALVGCGLGLVIERIFKRPLLAAICITMAWGLLAVLAFYTQFERTPPVPFTAVALDNEPWESLVWPVSIMCLLWPIAWRATSCCIQWRGWAVMALSAIPLLAALAQAERFSQLFVGNSYWVALAMLAIAANTFSMERLFTLGAGRWALLVLLAQSLTATALVMTCYGSWGDWCKQVSAALAIIALGRLCIYPKPTATENTGELWVISLSVPVLVLNTGIFMHIRDYSQIALPTVVAPVALLIPTIVGLMDIQVGNKRSPWVRMAIAAVTSIVLCAIIIGFVLAQSEPE